MAESPVPNRLYLPTIAVRRVQGVITACKKRARHLQIGGYAGTVGVGQRKKERDDHVARLTLQFLGPAQVTVNNHACVLSPRLLGLLAYVAVEGVRPHRRESLSALLWPDKPYSAALGNLRSALRDLRKALCERDSPSPCLLATSAEIYINRQSDYWLDVAAFEALLRSGRGGDLGIETLEQAVELYRGPFLEDLVLSGSTGWEEWVLIKREACHRQMQRALSALVGRYETRREYERAIAWAQRAIELDPWQEEMHRQLMRLLALCGRRSAAIVQYRHCELIMRRDLGMQLSSETIALYEQIRDGVIIVSPHELDRPGSERPPPAMAVRKDERRMSPRASEGWEQRPRLVARNQEMARLEGHLRKALDGHGRVVLVSGEAGSGKTALVEAYCREAMDVHPGLLVSLARCSAQRGIGDAYQPVREMLQVLTTPPDSESDRTGRSHEAPPEQHGEGADWAGGVLSGEHAHRLQAALPTTLAALADTAPDLVRLIGHPSSLLARAEETAARAPWLDRLRALASGVTDPLSALARPNALHAQITEMVCAVSRQYPLLLVLDDLHWADAPSLDLLFHLGRHVSACRILLVATFRPEDYPRDCGLSRPRNAENRLSASETPTGRSGTNSPLDALSSEFQRLWGDIRIDLDRVEGGEFVSAYLDAEPNRLRSPFRRALVQHTGGNPLFTVELVRAMQEHGDLVRDAQGRWIESPHLDWQRLPPRVEGSIAQRVGRLTPWEQQLLTVASVIGVGFHAQTLAHVLGLPVAAVISCLSGSLSRERIVEALGVERIPITRHSRSAAQSRPSDEAGDLTPMAEPIALSRYRFRHELFQTYLYGRLDAVVRSYLHGAVGDALEEMYGADGVLIAGQLAQHFEAADRPSLAADYLLEAGRQAACLGAHRQAISCYEHALALLSDLPRTVDRSQREFALQMAVDSSLVYASGWGAPERLRSSVRAYELAQQDGPSTAARLQSLRAVANLSAVRGEFGQAIVAATDLLALAERAESPLYIASAHATLAVCAAMQGDVLVAWEHIATSLDFCRQRSHELTAEETQALRPHAELTAGFVLLAMGRLDEARRQMSEILSFEYHNAPQTIVPVHSMTAVFYALLREDRLAQQHASQALRAIEEAADAPELHAWSDGIMGWVETRAGRAQRGIPRLLAAIKSQPPRGTLIFRFAQMAFLVEAYLAAGDLGAALDAAEQSISQVQKTGVRYLEAEFWRLKGEILLQIQQNGTPSDESAAACFERAIEIARARGMRLWELRARVSLTRVQPQHGGPYSTLQGLADLYASFHEDPNTPDLIAARELLSAAGLCA